jgi:hypothetical protein
MDQGEDFDGDKGNRSLTGDVSPIGGHYERGGVVATDVQLPRSSILAYVFSELTTGPYYLRPEYTNYPASFPTKSSNLNAAIITGELHRLLI